jgi:hypothetical protein
MPTGIEMPAYFHGVALRRPGDNSIPTGIGSNDVNRFGSGVIRFGWGQDRFVRLQISLDGLDAVAGAGGADGVRLAQFVMHKQPAHQPDTQMRFRHAPKLTRFQRGLNHATGRLGFYHGLSCAYIFN